MKKLCVGFGNCQVHSIRQLLEEFTNFSDTYEMETFANWQMINHEKYSEQQSKRSNDFFIKIQHADLVIYQPLRDEYGCYSTNPENPDSFLKLLKPECVTVSFPRLCCHYFFPIIHKKQHASLFYGSVLRCPETIQELHEKYENGILEFDIQERIERSYFIGKEKEENTNCKIIDYIFTQLPKRRIFHTQDHPATIIYIEILRQIGIILHLEYDHEALLKLADENDNYVGHLDSIYERPDRQYPFSRYVIHALKLSYAPEETQETKDFYKSILTHWFLTQQKGLQMTYPYINTIPMGVAYRTDLNNQIFPH
jgi:hypothetical protein